MLYQRFFAFLGLLVSLPMMVGSASAGQEDAISSQLNGAMRPVADFLETIIFFSVKVLGQSLPIVLVVLGGTAIFLTLRFKFLNIRAIGLAYRTVKGKYTDEDAPGQITHFQALTAALSATVGLGNIAGVAMAVSVGGPGATFWMILMGLCGMTTKFCECTLGVKYRKIDDHGRVHGGGMYYLSQGLKEKGLGGLGKVLAVFFAVMCIGSAIGAGNMFQVNQAASQMSDAFGIFQGSKLGFGLIVAVIVGLVIIGGIVVIARVTSFLIPLMCGMYVLVAFAIIATHLDDVGDAFSQIITGAFSPMAVGGGFIGVLIQGIQRAAFSNEAGIGSSPIAHSAVKTRKPASEGLVALLEPFTDTVVVCTMTALVIIMTGMWKVDAIVKKDATPLFVEPGVEQVVKQVSEGDELRLLGLSEDEKFGEVWEEGREKSMWVTMTDVDKVEGIGKTSRAFGEKYAWFPKLLAVAVLLFAFSTMISWSYYGEQAVIYLCGGPHEMAILIYKLLFCGFVVVGAVTSLSNVIRVSDAMLFAMVIPNMIGLYVLLPVVRNELADFRKHVAEIEGKE
ncbi:alanine:cation symporter family protein [Verrucomicrobiaceae bacterium N1E253]|uniref:Alanine:cation symporter family protein n=1 Tax=Oceaniferula marina TaxID=2748318 RepID=A0A851GRK3_9BACT|nr:alanine/glycine:cation symporter family protein [Oceaniferula marina]NWK56844.1 alanine:cation symporter family protein [Oceaniferula marina]